MRYQQAESAVSANSFFNLRLLSVQKRSRSFPSKICCLVVPRDLKPATFGIQDPRDFYRNKSGSSYLIDLVTSFGNPVRELFRSLNSLAGNREREPVHGQEQVGFSRFDPSATTLEDCGKIRLEL